MLLVAKSDAWKTNGDDKIDFYDDDHNGDDDARKTLIIMIFMMMMKMVTMVASIERWLGVVF